MVIVSVFGSGIILSMLFINFEHRYLSNFFGAFANLTYVLVVLYITNTKSLVDIKKSLSISISHILVLGLILSTYFHLTSYIEDFNISPTYIIISSIFLSPLFIAYSKITEKIIRKTSRIFAKNSYDKNSIIIKTTKKLRESASIDDISNILNDLFLNTINTKKVIFFRVINNQDTPLINSQNVLDITPNSDPCIRHAYKEKKIFFSDEVPKKVKSYMEALDIEVVIPIPGKTFLSSIIYVGKPAFSRFYLGTDIAIFEWLENALPNTIARIEKINKLKKELNDSRKTLSMLEVMNQYHHDIKTPLAVIDGIVSADMYDKDFQREVVVEQVKKGTKLIATMANILRGKRNREVKKLKLHECIQQCLFLFDNRFEKITADFNENLDILGDDIDLKILFSNLLKNASEAADPKRALTLKVSAWNDKQHVYTSITDTGLGIPPETIENLWNLEKSEKETGSAIGLQAVKRIVEEHEAQIYVTSVLGSGTRFELRFPRAIR